MQSVKIEVLNPVYARCLEGASIAKKALSYKETYYRATRFGKKRTEYDKSLMLPNGVFYMGLANKLRKYCDNKNVAFEITNSPQMRAIEREVRAITSSPELPGITLRPDQKRLIKNAIQARRGILVSPTGSGKTVIAASIMKCFDGSSGLFLCPRVSILKQTVDELKRFGFNDICFVGNGNKTIDGKIVVATIQTMALMPLEKIGHTFDWVMLDEAHLSIDAGGQGEKVLREIPAPIRIGFTATPAKDESKRLTAEGLIGGIIDEVTWDEGQDIQMLAEPKLELVSIPRCSGLTDLRRYADIYSIGIVQNKLRNRMIIDKAIELIDRGKTVMTFIVHLEHGEELLRMALGNQIRCEYVHGSIDADERNRIRKKLEDKKLEMVIASVAWREGVNVKSLGAAIMAGHQKSEIGLLQFVGRALRRSPGKDEAIIVDFLDLGKYLSEHSIERLQVYKKMGLL